jgi:oxalate decarboxylase
VILAGRSRWVFVEPNGAQDVFEAGKGDVVFAPQGHYLLCDAVTGLV